MEHFRTAWHQRTQGHRVEWVVAIPQPGVDIAATVKAMRDSVLQRLKRLGFKPLAQALPAPDGSVKVFLYCGLSDGRQQMYAYFTLTLKPTGVMECSVKADSVVLQEHVEKLLRAMKGCTVHRVPLSNEGAVKMQPSTTRPPSGQPSGQPSRPPPPPPEPTRNIARRPYISNVVCSADLSCQIHLQRMALSVRRPCENLSLNYNPRRISTLQLQRREPFDTRYVTGDRESIYKPLTTTCTLSSGGKMSCMGCRHEEQARKALRRYARIIQQAGFPCRFHDFHITNVAATATAGFEINLDAIACSDEHALSCIYEPEIASSLNCETRADDSHPTHPPVRAEQPVS